MHQIDIPQWVIDRAVAKRGAEHVFTDLDAAKTALIVIDMQNAFMLPGVGFRRYQDSAGDRPEHQSAGAVYTTFGDIMPTEMVVGLLTPK